ncbi:hypothetical protein CRUP_004192 [Coryphaenoides rupestris]|nr:hypothetical protein CRUP_004192 [Coryphaenoides rupestris]
MGVEALQEILLAFPEEHSVVLLVVVLVVVVLLVVVLLVVVEVVVLVVYTWLYSAVAIFSMEVNSPTLFFPARRATPLSGSTPLPENMDAKDTMKQVNLGLLKFDEPENVTQGLRSTSWEPEGWRLKGWRLKGWREGVADFREPFSTNILQKLFLSDRILKAARVVYHGLLERNPGLMRDRKHHLKTHRQCCSGKELVDWLLKLNESCQSRSQAVGMWQVLVDERLLVHGERGGALWVRKELAAVLVFETHAKAGTGDKGTSWYIIWKGSVNVITHGKGLVTTLHEGEDFGQLALLNDAPRAATIILREDNCHFLRVDKQDFIRILKDVEANTVRLEEHGKTVLVLEKSSEPSRTGGGGAGGSSSSSSSKYTVMSGTPEKILEHLLEKVKLDANGNDAIVSCPSEGSEPEKAEYSLNARQKVVKLIGQWVLLYGVLLKDDPVALDFLESLQQEVAVDCRLIAVLREQGRERRRTRTSETGYPSLIRRQSQQFDWFCNCEEPVGRLQPIRAQDNVLYEIFRPDNISITLMLPVNTSVHEVLSAAVKPGADYVLVKMNSEPLKEQQGPEEGTADTLEQMCSKDLAAQLTGYDWELFTAMHEVELIYYVFGRGKFPGATTANLQRLVRRFNEVQHWVATRIPSKTKRIYCAYERLMDPSRNHRAYRLAVAKLSPPYIPFMPLLLKDMTFIHEGNKNYTDKLVNFEKMRMIAKTVKIVHGCRSQLYVHSSPTKGLADRMLLETPSAIRISTYCDSLPCRSPSNIRLYVQNLNVIDNQRRLTELSRSLER